MGILELLARNNQKIDLPCRLTSASGHAATAASAPDPFLTSPSCRAIPDLGSPSFELKARLLEGVLELLLHCGFCLAPGGTHDVPIPSGSPAPGTGDRVRRAPGARNIELVATTTALDGNGACGRRMLSRLDGCSERHAIALPSQILRIKGLR